MVRNAYGISAEKTLGKAPLKDLDINGRIILKCILHTQDMNVRNGFRKRKNHWVFCEHGNEKWRSFEIAERLSAS
jgi:hypothetical protein